MIDAIMSNSPVRTVRAKVELFNGSTLLSTYSYNDALVSINIDRLGEDSKFFGFGVIQKATIKLRDKDRLINIVKGNSLKVYFSSGEEFVRTCPTFYVDDVNRDENTNELTITASDKLSEAVAHNYNDVGYSLGIIGELADSIASYLGLGYIELANFDDYGGTPFSTNYSEEEERHNFEGTEDLKTVLNAIAEATQTIYYLNANDTLIFKRLNKALEPVLTISKADYFTLESKPSRKLTEIVSATELGDNYSATTGVEGATQYVRDNPLWELRADIGALLNDALADVGGLTIQPFSCSWRGNYLLEIGDKIEIIGKDGSSVISYVLNDTLTYKGGFKEQTQWIYTENEGESASTPVTIGEAIKQTFAKVDKVNKEITIVAGESNANSEAISSLLINTESILASVKQIEETTNTSLDAINDNITTLTNQVSASITPEELQIEVSKQITENGVNKVQTTVGTFDDEGLTVKKDGSEMQTTISDNGMQVFKNNDAVLTANNIGVDAVNLHATTYLIIGNNSRFEDFKGNRTACFWIGG